MTASRASAALLAIALIGGPAAAADAPGAPVPLGPQPTRPAPSPSAAPAASPTTPGPTGGAVTVDRLGAVDPDSVGLIGNPQGGLGVDLWRGTSRSVAAGLLQALPAPLESPALRRLERRLLLTTATAPEGKAEDGPLLLHRAQKLLDLGDAQAAIELVRAAPTGLANERIARIEVEGLFLGNDNAGACARARGVVGDYQGSYWQQALAYCLALAGDSEKAAMIADLLRERGAETPPAFFALMDAVSGDRNARIPAVDEPTALLLSMMRTANRKLPDSMAQSSRPAVLRAVALAPNADLAARLAAAERAAVFGAISPEELADIYAGIPFTPDELANPIASAEAQWGPRGRALLLRAALAQSAPAKRAEVLQRALQLGREKGGLAELRRAILPALDGIAPAPELMFFAADAATALYAAGRTKEASAWYDAAEAAAPNDQLAARAWTVLWPLSRLVAGDKPWDANLVTKWRAAQAAGGDDDAARSRAATVFALFEAFGQPVPSEAWSGLVRGARTVEASMPDPAVWYALDRAARDGRRGEAVALTLIAIGPRGPRAASAMTLAAAIAALLRADLDADAHAMALEAAAGG